MNARQPRQPARTTPGSPRQLGAAIAGLWALAVAQPILDLTGRNPEFLVAHGLGRWQVVLFALGLALGLPLVLGILVAWISRALPSLGKGLGLAVCAMLGGILALQVLARAALPGAAAIALALCAAALVAGSLARWDWLARFAAYLAPAALVVPLFFLVATPARQLLAKAPEIVAGRGVSTTPLVLVILDELPLISLLDRDLHIDAERFPNFARLEREATWFRDASTVADSTATSVPAMLSGRRPRGEKLAPTAANHPSTLFQLLSASHQLVAFEDMTQLCPAKLCAQARPERSSLRGFAADLGIVTLHLLLPADLRQRLPQVDQAWRDFDRESAPGDDQSVGEKRAPPANREDVGQFLSFVLASLEDGDRAGGRPTAYVLHLMLPHPPWRFLPSGRRYHVPGGRGGAEGMIATQWGPDERHVNFGWQQHLLQTAYTDRLLGQLFDRLRSTGIWDRAVLAVVADHGAGFRPGGMRRALTDENYREILGVPLFIKRPGQMRGEIVERNVETIDLLPTLAAAVGVEVPWPIDGEDLFRPNPAPRAEKRAQSFSARLKSGAWRLPAGFLGEPAELLRRLEIFGTGPAAGLLRYGPSSTWIGRPLAALPRGAAADISVSLSEPSAFAAVDPEQDPLPILVVGTLKGARARAGTKLAIAMNGVVAGTTWSVEAPDGPRFRVLVGESALRAGKNTVEVFAIEGEPPVLRATAEVAPAVYAFHDGEIVDGSGRPLRWGSKKPVGEVTRRGDELIGSVRTRPGQGPVKILVFAETRFVTSLDLRPQRRFRERGASEIIATPFTVLLPGAATAGQRIRVFAILGQGQVRRLRVLRSPLAPDVSMR
jgi:hypothetical protein